VAVPRLGELFLAERLITPAHLEEALEAQVIYGGRLGTNLLELGFCQEADLARLLGKRHSMPFASGEMLPDPAAIAVADVRFFDDADVLPMRIEPTRLTLAVLEPAKPNIIDPLSFKVGRRVLQVVIPEFRMHQVLRKYAKAFRPLRSIDLNALRPSRQTREVQQQKEAEVGDLMNEDDFAKLYAKAVGGSEPAEETVPEAELVPESPPLRAPRPAAPPQAMPAGGPVPAPVRISPPLRGQQPPQLAPQAPLQDPELPPLSFAEAQAMLQSSADREDIARIVLRFARSKFRRALLFNVRGDLVTGWHGMGMRVREKAVARIGISLAEPNSFKLVRDLRAHFVGPMAMTASIHNFYALLGGRPPATAVIIPLLVRGKPVHFLYLDIGPKLATPPDVGELLIVSQSVTRSYEALIRQRTGA
jgi:hypothetical protein